MEVRFLAPLVLLALLAIPLIWLVPRRLERFWHGAIRAAVFAALIVALAQPIVFTRDRGEHQVFVVDASASVAAEDRAGLTAAIDRGLATLSEAARAVRVDVGESGGADPRFAASLQIEDSSLSRALTAAARAIPAGARGAITVFSDGASTDRDHGVVCQELTARRLPVHWVTLARRPRDVYPVAVTPRDTLRVGATARLDVDVVGAGDVTITVEGPDGPLAEPQTVAVRDRGVASFEVEPQVAGFLPVGVTVSAAADAHHDNDFFETELAVQDPLRVLYLGQRLAGSGPRVEELLGAGFDLTVRDRVGDGGLGLDAFDLVFVDDCPASELVAPFQRELVEAVRDAGLGLMFAGGRASFGPGGYHDSELAEALPVEFVQKEEKRDPSTTLVLIIDTSGSMGGMRVTLAKEVSRLAMKRLLPHDKVGIVEFYGAKRWAAPIQPASNLIELQRALNRLDSGGGTVILPAIEEAFYGLQNVDTRYKHVLILTDGGVESGAFEPLLRRMADRGINVSTVLVGPEAHSEFLVSLANWGKGRFYNVPNRFNIPELILKQPASAQLPAYRPGEHHVRGRGGRGWWGDVDPGAVPPLQGYVETRARPGALTLLETESNRTPVLATWRHGLGRVTALATEATGPGTSGWAGWEGFGPWLARVIARTARDDCEPFAYSIRRRGAVVTVRADRRAVDDAMPAARLLDDAGTLGDPVAFRRRSHDAFEATRVVDPAAALRVVAGSNSVVRLVSPPSADRAAELQVDPAAVLPIEQLASATGGRAFELASFGAQPIATGGAVEPVSVLSLWPWLLGCALLLYLFELLFRRLPART